MSTAKSQGKLPGMVPPEISEIIEKALEVQQFQEERMAAAEAENLARADLLVLMKKHNRKQYPLDDKFEVIVESSEQKAFVRRKKGVKKDKTKPAKDGSDDSADEKKGPTELVG